MTVKKCCRRSGTGNLDLDLDKVEVNCVEPEVAADRDEDMSYLKGIPDDITIYHILTKLPWTAMFPISRVNSRWRRLVKSRQLYNARVITCRGQTLVPIMHRAPMYGSPVYAPSGKLSPVVKEESLHNEAMSVYDPVMESWHLLPPVPPLVAGIPEGCGCVCLNGKIYVLGGLHASQRANSFSDTTKLGLPADNYDKGSRKDVYSLDLAAGDTTWTKCADMNCGRAWFHCGVNDGNIYVFWGVNGSGGTKGFERAVVEVEVYDPEQDLWDIVAPVPCPDLVKYSMVNKFATVGETFVIHSYFCCKDGGRITVEHTYDTGKDEWKIVQHAKGEAAADRTDAFVTMNQKLYTIDPKNSTLKVYNEDSGSWSSAFVSVLWEFLDPTIEPMPFRPYLQGLLGLSSFLGMCPEQQLYNNNSTPTFKDVQEVLALTVVRSDLKDVTIVGLTRTTDIITQFRNYPVQLALFTGKWSGHDQLQIVFQEIECPHTLLDWQKFSFCPLQL
ncbi:unnamed protein product [Calypogeia fissa]